MKNRTELMEFLRARPFGFVTEADLPRLIELDRLCQLVVRCGGKRFCCAAQDCAGMVDAVERSGDYVRDVALTVGQLQSYGVNIDDLWRKDVNHAQS